MRIASLKRDKVNRRSLPKFFFSNGLASLVSSRPSQQLEFFSNVLDQIGDELMLIRSDGRIVYVNNATAQGLGYSRQFLLNQFITKFMKEKMSIKRWKKIFLAKLRKTKKPLHFVIERVVKGNKIQTIDVTAVYMPFYGDDYILSVARDITQQRNLQNRLRESEEAYRILTEEAADGIFTCDLTGKITYTNKAGARLLKKTLSKILGTHFSEYPTQKSLSKAFKIFYSARRGVSGINEEVEIMDSQGKIIPLDVHVTPLYKEGKIFRIHAVVRDISKRKELEYWHRETEKVQALTHFISGTVHEIQYPLTLVLGRLQNILKSYKQRDYEYIGYKDFCDILSTIENVTRKIKHCHDIITRLLTISQKRWGGKREICAATETIREAVKLVEQQQIHPKIKLKLHLAPQNPYIAISEIELQQVLINVLTNALQAMPAGGVVFVKTGVDVDKGIVSIVIKDQGVGIKKEHLSRIFAPFFTTKQIGAEKSVGLGLSLVYAIVHAHQGRIDVKSNLRQGTVVKIDFPLAKK